jgi:hypothetical protein
MNPKVFISHATEDKERFVLDFAEKLRNKGVDAWLDKWEMLPGDSLVDKIFEEGIKSAKAIIVVLSSNSVGKKWVREELDAAMVKRVNKGSLLIPVVLDDCEIPECLHSTIWQKIPNLGNYEEPFNRILSAIYDHREKPTLGEVPEFARTAMPLVSGHTRSDSIILKIACEIGLTKDSLFAVNTKEVLEGASLLGISEAVVWDSLEVLDHKGLTKLHRVLGGLPPNLEVTTSGLERFAETYVADYETIKTQVVASLVNNNMRNVVEIATKLGVSVPMIKHIFRLLEMNGYVKVSREYGPPQRICNVSPTLKRLLE